MEAHLAANTDGALSALIVIDLDNFKSVNDTYGHLFGDTLLTRIALEISGLFRGSDIIARIGGDEFMVYAPNIPQRLLIEQRCTKLISTVQNLFDGQLKSCGLSCSIGIAFTPDHGTAYRELFQHADRALYQAKNMGKATYMVYEPLSAAVNYASKATRIDSDSHPQWSRNNLAHSFFEMLYESSNVEVTINNLLAIVGKQTNVSRVYIFENNPDDTACSNTFEWCNEGISAEIDTLQNISYEHDIPGFRELFNEQDVLYCSDIRELPDAVRGFLEPQDIKSILHCAIRDKGRFRGYVGLDDNNTTRLWTKEQIDLLVFLAQIISIFLLKERGREEADTALGDISRVLNRQRDRIYVVDAENYQLRFINDSAKKMMPHVALGVPCYQALMGRSSPCESCPIHSDGEIILNNGCPGMQMYAVADPIHWKGKDEWLVSCRAIDET